MASYLEQFESVSQSCIFLVKKKSEKGSEDLAENFDKRNNSVTICNIPVSPL